MFKKAALGLAFLCLLMGGSFFSHEGHRLTVSLFIHYLQGSGQTVSLKLPSFLDKYCQEAGLSDTYESEWGYAFGTLTCNKSGAYDVYDFKYASDASACERVTYRFLTPRTYDVIRAPYRLTSLLADTPANLGRCIVGLGYGKPFEVYVTK
jgi:hypothetical protein